MATERGEWIGQATDLARSLCDLSDRLQHMLDDIQRQHERGECPHGGKDDAGDDPRPRP